MLAELQSNCVAAVDSVIKSLASETVLFGVRHSNVIVGAKSAIGASQEDSVGKIVKIINKQAAAEGSSSGRKNSPNQVFRSIWSFAVVLPLLLILYTSLCYCYCIC